jgi:hypothetical protein
MEVVGGSGLVEVGSALDLVRNEVGVNWLKEGSGGNDVDEVGELISGRVNLAFWPSKESLDGHLSRFE